MGRISFNEVGSSNSEQVSFFSLNDGEEAIVRFVDDSVSDFEILSLHNVELDGKYRKVSCLRDPHDGIDKCPLCNAGFKITNRVFFKLIHYYIDGNQVGAKPEVWDAPYSIARTLSKYIQDYGPLSDYLCKVTRQGTKLDTTYIISPNLSKSTYPDNVFIKDSSKFENYSALGRIVMDKSYDDMVYFINNKKFPEVNNDSQNSAPNVINNTSNYISSQDNAMREDVSRFNPVSAEYHYTNTEQTSPRKTPWETATTTIDRPTRY